MDYVTEIEFLIIDVGSMEQTVKVVASHGDGTRPYGTCAIGKIFIECDAGRPCAGTFTVFHRTGERSANRAAIATCL